MQRYIKWQSEYSFQSEKEFSGFVVAIAATYGGMMSVFSKNWILELVKRGAEVHFIASNKPIYGNPPPINDLEAMGGRFHGINLCSSFSPLNDMRAVIELTNVLRSLQVDILHTRGSVMGLLGRLAGRLAAVSCIFHHQDDLFARDLKHSNITRRCIGLIESAFSRLSHKNIFVSCAVLENALSFGFDKKKCVEVGNDIHPDFLKYLKKRDPNSGKRHDLLDELGIPENAFVIGCIGRLLELKGIDTLIRIARTICKEHHDCYFVVKGDGPEKGKLLQMIALSNLQDRFFLYDKWIPVKELPAVYKSFDIFVLPTRREGFGMVFAEAMAAEVPVVGPKIRPITEIVPNHCGILVEAEDTNAYCGAIRKLFKDNRMREVLGRTGSEYALKFYGGKNSSKEIIDVYQKSICDLKRGVLDVPKTV